MNSNARRPDAMDTSGPTYYVNAWPSGRGTWLARVIDGSDWSDKRPVNSEIEPTSVDKVEAALHDLIAPLIRRSHSTFTVDIRRTVNGSYIALDGNDTWPPPSDDAC